MTDIEDRYYSMPEIMKYLGISRDTALRWITTKQMPAHNFKMKVEIIYYDFFDICFKEIA